MVQALLPLKDLVEAKSRLAGLLRPSERRALAQAMAEDVLSVLQMHPAVDRVTLVSDDPGAGLLSQKYGANCWPEASLGCRGLNSLIETASRRLLATGDGTLLVLHGDLPLLDSGDIDAVLQRRNDTGGLVIGCDRRGRGTNLLAFDADTIPDFCFGENSCSRHLASAGARGIQAQVLRRAGIECDVDEVGDLKYLRDHVSRGSGGNTATLIHAGPWAARLEVALSSLADHPGDDANLGRSTSG